MIWDYKTGGTWKFNQEPRPFWAGRVVQHALYLAVLKAVFKARAGEYPGATVERFGYFFPSEKAGGERIEFTSLQLKDGERILGSLASVASSGAFMATHEQDKDCGLCDYRRICGDVVGLSGSSARKMQNTANAILAPYKELRAHGKTKE
jgi:hypothetical protein